MPSKLPFVHIVRNYNLNFGQVFSGRPGVNGTKFGWNNVIINGLIIILNTFMYDGQTFLEIYVAKQLLRNPS